MARLQPLQDTCADDEDLRALRSHPRRLLLIAGALLSVLLLAALATAVWLHARSYEENRLQAFIRARTALEAQLTRHDASYARLVNMTEYAWRHRTDRDPAVLEAETRRYVADGQTLRLQQGAQDTPQLVLGLGTDHWPAERLHRYLALARTMSVITRMAFNGPGAEAAGAAYFLDPTGHLVVINEGLDDSGTGIASAERDRQSTFSQLRAYAHLLPPASAADTVPALRASHGRGEARIGFAAHPVTGRASLVTVFPAHDGRRGLGVFVAFEPTAGLAQVLREASDSNLQVMAPNGEVILGSRSAASDGVVGTLHDAGIWSHPDDGIVKCRRNGRRVIASLVTGTDWALVTTVGWRDMLADGTPMLCLALALWAGLMAGLWGLLAWVDRQVLAPAAARAMQVYANEALFRSLIQMTPAGLCLVDIEQRVPQVQNELARRYAGAAERSGVALYDALVDGYAEAVSRRDENLDIREFQIFYPGGRGAVATHLLVNATPLFDSAGRVLLCTLQDLTARVELQVQKDQLRDEAEAAHRARSRFLAAMSHEIRTPLHGILGHLELFARSSLDIEQRARLGRITQSADSLLLIINDVLDLERAASGRLELDSAVFEPALLLERVALLYAPLSQGKGVDLDLLVDGSLAPRYIGAADRVEQVLRNLVSNAVKFTASGRIEIRAVSSRHPHCLRLEVADSGVGLSGVQQRRLFEPFAQADASIAGRFGGSGLGLTLSRQLCHLMGGEIDVHSTPGVGSVFGFDIQAQAVETTADAAPPLQGRDVLLYSTTVTWRDELARRLRAWGAKVVVLESLQQIEAVASCRALPLVIFERNQRAARGTVDGFRGFRGRIVRVRGDGPLRAAGPPGDLRVSAYSAAALLEALQADTADEGIDGTADPGGDMETPATMS